MAPFHADTFIDSLSDPKNGRLQNQLTLMYLGLDLLEMNEQLEESRFNVDFENQSSESAKSMKNQSYPWWKIW